MDTTTPHIPDYTLLTKAGEGAYGEVYLARSVTGQYRAVKVVYRDRIGSREAFDREFRGAQAYETVSRKHPGLLDILHVGRDDQNGFFYYVMDAADDIRSGQALDTSDYRPRTLRAYLTNRTALPVEECIAIGIELASALEFLQENGLVHRDIKPSNVVFVGGRLKLADIGLVAETGEAKSIVGTEGYTPPENHGSFAGDVYSLGKLLYEITTGCDSQKFGEAPCDEADTDDFRFAGLNKIIDKACAAHLSDRYQTAKALRLSLDKIQRNTVAVAEKQTDSGKTAKPKIISTLIKELPQHNLRRLGRRITTTVLLIVLIMSASLVKDWFELIPLRKSAESLRASMLNKLGKLKNTNIDVDVNRSEYEKIKGNNTKWWAQAGDILSNGFTSRYWRSRYEQTQSIANNCKVSYQDAKSLVQAADKRIQELDARIQNPLLPSPLQCIIPIILVFIVPSTWKLAWKYGISPLIKRIKAIIVLLRRKSK